MTIHAGIKEIVITPPIGVELAGYSFGPSQGVLDELKAQALYLEEGEGKVVILTADLLAFGDEFVAAVRQRIEQETGIPLGQVMLSASHTHSGPTTMPFRQWGAVDVTYLQQLEDDLVGAVVMAVGNAQPVRLSVCTGGVESISENRRGLSDIRDTSVSVIRLDGENGQPLCVLFSFGCHPVSLHSYRNLFSPDYPGYTRKTVRAVLGEEAQVMFILGAAGDINPRGYVPRTFTPEHSRQMGMILGCEVAKTALEANQKEHPILQIMQVFFDLPIIPLPLPEDLKNFQEQCTRELERLYAGNADDEKTAVWEIQREWAVDGLQAWKQGGLGKHISCEVTVVRLGDAVLLFAPLELFTETALAIGAASPAQTTLVCSNSNGALGYLPTLDAYAVSDYTNPQGLAPKVYGVHTFSKDAEPIFRRNSIQLIKEVFP